MKFRKKQRNKTSSVIWFVPLANVVFLLLFFSAGMQVLSVRPEPAPAKGSIQGTQPAETVTLSILPGRIVLDGKPSQKQALAAIPAGKTIVVSVSPQITYLYLADLLEIIRSSGHADVYFATSPIHNQESIFSIKK